MMKVEPMMKVEVVRSPRRRKTVSARQVGDVVRVSVPATMTRAEEEHWVTEMVRRIKRRQHSASVDLEHDAADINRMVTRPTLVLYGSAGRMAELFDIPAQWRNRCTDVTDASLPGGHFFVDKFPQQTAQMVKGFLGKREG